MTGCRERKKTTKIRQEMIRGRKLSGGDEGFLNCAEDLDRLAPTVSRRHNADPVLQQAAAAVGKLGFLGVGGNEVMAVRGLRDGEAHRRDAGGGGGDGGGDDDAGKQRRLGLWKRPLAPHMMKEPRTAAAAGGGRRCLELRLWRRVGSSCLL
ncbi:unnamed protein product [Victoria cruziana]